MSRHGRLSPAMLVRVAAQFKALAEPSRLRLMQLLQEGEWSVSELAEKSELSFANTSKHLAMLHGAGFVVRRKAGLNVRYALADESTRELCELMCARIRDRAAAEHKSVRG